MTAPGVLDRVSYVLVHLVQFRWTRDGVPHELNLNTAGAKVRLDRLHVAKLLSASDVVSDASGSSRLLGTLRLIGPHSVRYNDASWLVYPSMSAILQAFPEICSTALVKVRIEVTDPHGTTEVKTLMTDAGVAAVSNCDGMTITFDVEQRNLTALVSVPQRTLSKRTVPSAWVKYLDKDSAGSPMPLALGDCLPGMLEEDTTSWWRYKLGVLGLTVPKHPCVRSHRYRNTTEWRDVHLWCEKVTGMDLRESDYDSVYVDKALVYSYWKDASGTDRYGTSVDGAFSSSAQESAYSHAALARVRPWVMYPIVPEPVNDDAGEAAAAVDGNPLTYATIPPGGFMEFEIADAENRGRISMNSTDSGTDATDLEGAGAPVGLKVLAFLAMPPGGQAPGASQAVVAFTWPNGDVYKSAQGTFTPPASGYELCQVNLPFLVAGHYPTEDPAGGWCGTSFGTWSFKTGPSNTGPDAPNYYANNKELPFRIRITNNGSAGDGPIYVVATTLAVGCQLNRASLQIEHGLFQKLREQVREANYNEEFRETFGYYDGESRALQFVPGTKKGRYKHRGRGSVETLPPPRLSSVSVSRASFKDDVSGTYTGDSHGIISEPIEMMRLVLERLCGAEVVTDGGFGDYETTRDRMRSWYGGGDQRWKMRFSVTSRGTAESVLSQLASACMGLSATRLPDGRYAFWNWPPVSGLGPERFYRGSDADCEIDVDRMVLKKAGLPQLEVGRDGPGSIINDLEITYGSNAHNIATASWDLESDDGTGSPWGYLGIVPNSTLTAFDLCLNSKQAYGARPTKRINLPQVESRIVAQMAGMYYLGRNCHPERTLDFSGVPRLHDLYPGMVFRLSDALETRLGFLPPFWPTGTRWSEIYWMATESAQRNGGESPSQAISAVCVPWTIGEKWLPTTGPTPPPDSAAAGIFGSGDAGLDPNSPN